MIILENKFTPIEITLSLSDIGIDTEKIKDTTDEIGGGLVDSLYLPIKYEDKLLSLIKDMVEEIAIDNGYYWYPYMTIEETDESFPNVFPIPYKASFDLEYSPNGEAELQVWIEPKNPNDQKYLKERFSGENIPVTLDNDDMKYMLNVFTEIIINEMYN